MLNLRKLFIDVFDPQPGENAGVMMDLPHGALADDDQWRRRRAMASRWHRALSDLGRERGFTVEPLVQFAATGMSNGPLPEHGDQDAGPIALEEMAARTTLLLALTEFSASAPLIDWTKTFPRLRAASMPRIAPEMEATALAADYTHVARSCQRLRDRLAAAASAEIEFSTGDQFTFDFRFRVPEMDDGRLPFDLPPPRLINLPSGEGYIAAYEGERGEPSRTRGILPMAYENEIVRARVEKNRVEEIMGDTAGAQNLREFLFRDPARCNVAELGLGCNPMARVWGNVLEDEKAGPHIALGRSEHLGGVTGPDAFQDPRYVWHEDFVYARGCPIQITRLDLLDVNGERELLFANGSYVAELEIGI
jgi:leucyl aminopeptidase (aminopeptidase T)